MKAMKMMKHDVSRGRASSRRGTPDSEDGATSYKSRQLLAIGFRLLSVEQRRTPPATDKEGRT
jgi:hypothetical protein